MWALNELFHAKCWEQPLAHLKMLDILLFMLLLMPQSQWQKERLWWVHKRQEPSCSVMPRGGASSDTLCHFGEARFPLWVFVKKKSTNMLGILNSFFSLSQPPYHVSKSQCQIQMLVPSETHWPGVSGSCELCGEPNFTGNVIEAHLQPVIRKPWNTATPIAGPSNYHSGCSHMTPWGFAYRQMAGQGAYHPCAYLYT